MTDREVGQVVDYSFEHPAPQTIKDAGYLGVERYLGPSNTRLTAGERDALLAAGLSIGLVFETSATRASQGFAAGVADAQTANGQADALGAPDSMTLFYAVDFDATVAMVLPYFQGVASVRRRPFGPYGSLSVVEGILGAGIGATKAWQTVAWSHGTVSDDPRVVLYQRAAPTHGPIHGTDENACLAPDWGQWPRPPTHPPAPAPAPLMEDDMDLLHPHTGPATGGVWLRVGDNLGVIQGGAEYLSLVSVCGPVKDLDVTGFDRIATICAADTQHALDAADQQKVTEAVWAALEKGHLVPPGP